VIGQFKTKFIRQHHGPWPHLATIEFAAMDWIDRFNYRLLLESIGEITPAEAEVDTTTKSAQVA